MEKYKQSLSVKLLKIIVLPYGIILNQYDHNYGTIYPYLYASIIFVPNSLGEYWALATFESFIYKLDVLNYVIIASCLVTIVFINHSRKMRFEKLYNTVSTSNDSYFDWKFFKINNKMLTHRSIIFSCTCTVICLTMSMVIPILLAIFTNNELGSPPTLVYPSNYPWKVNSVATYSFTMLVQITVACLPLYVFASSILLTFYLKTMIATLCTRLLKRIDLINVTSKVMKGKKMEAEFKGVFEHYKFFRTFVKESIELLKPTAYVAVGLFIVVTISLISPMLLVNGNVLYKLKMLNAQIVLIVYISINCYLGEELSHVNDMIINRIYNTAWYNYSIPLRKDILLFMTLTMKPLQLVLYGSNVINLGLLTSAIKTTYSVVQVIYKSQNK